MGRLKRGPKIRYLFWIASDRTFNTHHTILRNTLFFTLRQMYEGFSLEFQENKIVVTPFCNCNHLLGSLCKRRWGHGPHWLPARVVKNEPHFECIFTTVHASPDPWVWPHWHFAQQVYIDDRSRLLGSTNEQGWTKRSPTALEIFTNGLTLTYKVLSTTNLCSQCSDFW